MSFFIFSLLCVYCNFRLYHLGDFNPSESKGNMAIFKLMYFALAKAIAERAQQNKCKSDPAQLANNVKILIKFFVTTGASLVLDFIKANIVFATSLVENTKSSKGNLLNRLTGITRATTDDVVILMFDSAGGYANNILNLK